MLGEFAVWDPSSITVRDLIRGIKLRDEGVHVHVSFSESRFVAPVILVRGTYSGKVTATQVYYTIILPGIWQGSAEERGARSIANLPPSQLWRQKKAIKNGT